MKLVMEDGGFFKRGSNTKMTELFGLNSIFGKEVNEIIIGKNISFLFLLQNLKVKWRFFCK